jgi:hypothetical protein
VQPLQLDVIAMATYRMYAYPSGAGRRLALVAAPSLAAARLHAPAEVAGEVRRATLPDLEGVVAARVSVPLVRANGRPPKHRSPFARAADFGLVEVP